MTILATQYVTRSGKRYHSAQIKSGRSWYIVFVILWKAEWYLFMVPVCCS